MYDYMKRNWNFNGGVWGAGVSEKSLSRGRLIWIFSETAQFHFETTIGDKIVETLYLTRVTSENKRICTPPLSPPFKVGVFVVFYR